MSDHDDAPAGTDLLVDVGLDLSTLPAPRATVLSVLDLAIEIAREGREGRKIGSLFVVGDHETVLEHSRCLMLDPLAGHPLDARRLTDPNLRETLKELAQLDGGFIITADGHALSAARYFDTTLTDVNPRLGLGGRHFAAASITARSDALGIVVSESSVVRVFRAGELIAELLPELWLLNRTSSHLRHPHITSHPSDNLAVRATRSATP